MTDYVNPLAHTGQQSPSFGVPSNPLVPPEYEQSIDYDSAQYMNGFLRTQIGRAMRVEQLIGSNGIQDRYGFLVGVGNNYLLLQDISNGNIVDKTIVEIIAAETVVAGSCKNFKHALADFEDGNIERAAACSTFSAAFNRSSCEISKDCEACF